MQGNLNEIDIRSIFQLIELGQRTGLLFVEADSNHHSYFRPGWDGVDYYACSHSDRPSWYVFFLNGQIIYAASGDNSLSRLNDYLHQYQVQVQLEQHQLDCLKTFNTLEYASLWKLLEENVINTTQARSIIRSLVYETLFDLLKLAQH
jgi:twitching motility two-component system response regulator PilG